VVKKRIYYDKKISRLKLHSMTAWYIPAFKHIMQLFFDIHKTSGFESSQNIWPYRRGERPCSPAMSAIKIIFARQKPPDKSGGLLVDRVIV
jgi:hypothetical protein